MEYRDLECNYGILQIVTLYPNWENRRPNPQEKKAVTASLTLYTPVAYGGRRAMILSSIAPQFHHNRQHDVRRQVVHRSATTITAVHCCNPNSAAALRQVNSGNNNNGNTPEDDVVMISSASAVAAAIRKASTSPVEFVQKIEQDGKNKGLVLPSSDFQTLCVEQLDLFRRTVDPDALLSV
ncbi:hypothetical protein L6452_21272 [Arctium lappa]|uniref:Uncharacterized protein n=1 Tax=Arctium lappa TaxID=4217 RepID=A0ACB9BEZ7_ARCLA|nr:hypothetical protein L6452_21272 [Arctium lappa]